MNPVDDLINLALELEENACARIDAIRHVDFAKRYVDGAIRLDDTVIHYETIRRRQFNRMLSAITSADKDNELSHALDYGCGKGYLLHLLAKSKRFSSVRGIEILPELCDIAKANLKALGHVGVSVECADARKYSDIDDVDTFIMFNPFPKPAMVSVVEQIKQSFVRRDRTACIAYINSIHEECILADLRDFAKATTISNLPRYGCESSLYVHRI